MPYKNVNKQREYQKKWNSKVDNERYKELGIPFGTACHRLRQQLFFKYLKKAEENFCYDCKKEILTVKEFSIQHKKVWFHVNPELFWDLDNIAFSHKKCNKAERYPRKKSPHGSVAMYMHSHCRCKECVFTHKIEMRKYRLKKKRSQEA